MVNLQTLVSAAKKAHPAFKFATATSGIAAFVVIFTRFGVSSATIVLGCVVFIGLMTLFVIFAQLSRLNAANVQLPAKIVLWTVAMLATATLTLLFSSTFFDYPLRIKSSLPISSNVPERPLHADVDAPATSPPKPDAQIPSPQPAPGPVFPVPNDLWRPRADSIPAMGNFIMLQSDSGDYIGEGKRFTYTPADADIAISTTEARLSVTIKGNENWTGEFQGMKSLSKLQAGYYKELMRYPFGNPVKGALEWSGEGRGCNTLQGWFVIDKITISDNVLRELDLRFEQRCENHSSALHGVLHWSA